MWQTSPQVGGQSRLGKKVEPSRPRVPGQRELAEKLAREKVVDGNGGLRVRTVMEIAAALIEQLGVSSTTVAMSAANRAVNKVDPGNKARHLRRKFTDEDWTKVMRLHKQGKN